MDTAFEQNFLAMTASIQQNKGLGRSAKAMLKPNHEVELQSHEKAVTQSQSCGCRVCYWARGRK